MEYFADMKTIQDVVRKWREGCSIGPAGQCAGCSKAALEAIEKMLGMTPREYPLGPPEWPDLYKPKGEAEGNND